MAIKNDKIGHYGEKSNLSVTSDFYFVRHLLVKFGGKESEIGSISDYVMMSIETYEKNGEVSEVFENMAMDELNHLRWLGKIIKLYGGNPSVSLRTIKSKKATMRDIENNKKESYREKLEKLLIKEIESVSCYEKLKAMTGNDFIKRIFDEIIKDEERHIEILRELLEKEDDEIIG